MENHQNPSKTDVIGVFSKLWNTMQDSFHYSFKSMYIIFIEI